ncbi:MAG TPA: CDP-glycerol glycerophosphotransferase family protein [Streptosporangiaceae bacterium]|nr:CDP-glycerol glycerophosphotransferase family protein [Streptosporangiaceae bacterium]
MPPTLSVVVPFYAVEQYLAECLESLRTQTLRDIEVIMVDDGSPDAAAVIAKDFADRDPRFVLLQQANHGLGPARNAGAARARGTYLAFADSDDVVARTGYELLVGSLEETGSDIACGNVARFDSARIYPSDMHIATFRTAHRTTHVTQRPSLLMDRTATNKVFRRSFWDTYGFSFPAGLYEDIPVTIPAHFRAASVDVLTDVVYYYRVRENGDASITQRRSEIANMTARLSRVSGIREFLAEHAPPELVRAYDGYVLSSDLRPYVNALGRADGDYRRRFRELSGAYLAQVDASVFDGLPAITRLRYHLLRRGLLDELLEVLDFEAGGTRRAGLVRKRRRWYAKYPFFGSRDIPDSVYELGQELRLRTGVDDVEWRNGRLWISGHAYVDGLGTRHRGRCRLVVLLRLAGTRRAWPVRVRRVRRPDVTATINQRGRCFDWSGFEVEIDPARLGAMSGKVPRTWELHVLLATRGTFRRGPLAGPLPGRAEHPPFRDIPDGKGGLIRVQPAISQRGHLVIRTAQVAARLVEYHVGGDALHLTGWTDVALPDDAVLAVRLRRNTLTVRAPLTVGAEEGGRRRFAATFALERLLPAESDRRPMPPAMPALPAVPVAPVSSRSRLALDAGVQWRVTIEQGGDADPLNVTVGDDFTATRHALRGNERENAEPAPAREIAITGNRYGELVLIERAPHVVVDRIDWTGDGRLSLAGRCADPDTRPAEISFCHHSGSGTLRFPLRWSGSRFTAAVSLDEVGSFGHRLAGALGTWDIRVEVAGERRPVLVERDLLDGLGGWHRIGAQDMELRTYRVDALRLVIRGGYADDERGAYAQGLLRRRTYPLLRQRPLRDLVVFESYFGTQYACNPRAIYEEMWGRGLDLEYVWTSDGGCLRPPGPARMSLIGSKEHYAALATARYIVSNCGLQHWYVKRAGQVYVQTWHGSPLKRIGFDIEAPAFERGRRRMELLGADAANWDLLVSQSAFTTPILRRALRYEGAVGEFGYPRNDVLHAGGPAAVARRAAAARARLGIPAGKRVVLYVPTWRDDQNSGPGVYGFDLKLDLERARRALGDDHVLLLRLHHLITKAVRVEDSRFVRDVSTYPDVNELYLASDILVTDYSSAMFDFGGTGRPMLFFAYDLERYRDTTRGLSFDFAARAPGPLLATSEEVIEAVRAVDDVAAGYAEAYADFRDTFCALDDGNAAARVVDDMLRRRPPA